MVGQTSNAATVLQSWKDKMKAKQQQLAIALKGINKYRLYKVTATELRPLWDYRADGLTLDGAKAALQAESDRQSAIRAQRCGAQGDDVLVENKNKYVNALDFAKRLLTEHADKQDSMLITPLSQVQSHTRATYPYRRPQFMLANGILGKVDFDVNEDWDYYSKRYNRPKTDISAKEVQFILPQVKYEQGRPGNIIVALQTNRQSVERFMGNWFLDALGRQFGMTRVEKSLRKVQLHECFALRKERSLAGVQIYARVVAGTVYDYCALVGKETYHAATAKSAIAGLRAKRESRVASEREVLTLKNVMRDYNFCATGIRNFCGDNGLDPDSEITRAELRNIVLKNRKLNCEKYSVDLRKVGINLNCK